MPVGQDLHASLGRGQLGGRLHLSRYLVEEPNRALIECIGRPMRVLDVGCGVGLNGAAARKKGAHVTGIEIEPAAAARARRVLDEVLDVDVTRDDAVARGLEGRTFDLLILGDVLEHTIDPAAVLRRLLPYVEEDGRVLVSLPNVAAWPVRLALLAGRFEYEPSGILDESHLRFFTRQSAIRLVLDQGLEVLRVEQNPMLVRAAKRLIARALVGAVPDGDPIVLSESAWYKLYHRFVRPLEDVIARRAPGLFAFQNVVVARRPPARSRLAVDPGPGA